MITVRAGSDVRYYLGATTEPSENYYTGATRTGEPAGRWTGRGAAAVGLSGEVTATQMQALYGLRIDPRDDRFADPSAWAEAPTIGRPRRRYETADEAYDRMLAAEPGASGERREQLRLDAERTVRTNVQYLDVTYSVQKSVSVLHLAFDRARVEAERAGRGDEARAWAAHRDAVEAAIWAGNAAALDYLQDRAGYSRIGHHGGTAGRWIDAHDWIVTSFLQHDSRDGDPQLHIHNPVLNLAECADGQWRTLDSRAITRHRGAAGALAERVTEEYLSRVLRVRFASRPDGKAREVVGMPAKLIAALSTRSRTLTPRAAALAAEFEARYGRPPNPLQLDRLKRQATLATRRPKSKDAETLAQRGERIDALMRELEGELRDGLAAVARSIPRLPEQVQPPAFSPPAVIETALADVQAARATWTRPDLTRAIANALPDSLGGLDAPAVRQLLDGLTDEALTHSDVQQVGGERDDALPSVAALRLADGSSAYDGAAGRTYALRSHIAGERALARAAIETGAVAVEPSAADAAIAALDQQGLVLGADQRQALAGILTSGARVETLVGPAGTGKSTVVGALARLWSDADQDQPRRVIGLAASQAATDVLAEEGVLARNVTRWLATQQRLAARRAEPDDAAWSLSAGDLVVVDEAAMLPTADLIAVHRHASAAGAKLLLTGDHRQLAAVGAGGGMALLAAAGGHELTEVRRFNAGWEGPASLRLRDGDEAVLHDYRRRGRLIDGGTREQARSSAARAWLADTLAGRRSVLIADTNEEAARLSAEVRAELIRLGLVGEVGVPLGRDGTAAGLGDVVQARRNGWELRGWAGNTRAPINRQTYRVTAVRDDGGLTVQQVDGPHVGETLALPPDYVTADLTLGYAGTVHSVQGRTVDTAHVVAGPATGRQALYVGLTRGRDANHAHVVTRAADESKPAGAVHFVPPADPLGVLAAILREDGGEHGNDSAAAQDDQAAARWASMQTAVERFAAEAELVYSARTTASLDRLTAEGALTADQRLALAADTQAITALGRLLRSAGLAGHDPHQVLAAAIAERDLGGARSIAQVLHRRIVDRHRDRLAPIATSYAEMIPTVASTEWQQQLSSRAEAADARRRQLGAQVAADPPQWAVEALGTTPSDPVARLDWEHRAGTVAAWRELAGHADPADALGPAAPSGQPEHYAAWRAAWTALGRPEPARAEAQLSDGQLRVRVRAMIREENWAPAYVGESLTAATLAADARRRDAEILAARAAAAPDPADGDRLRRAATEAAALADELSARVDQLATADQARSRWLVHTAVTREAADRARAELAARGAAVGPEAGDAVTPAEWLAAHQAEQAEADRNRPITSEHDLVDLGRQRDSDVVATTPAGHAAETDVPDARDSRAANIPDERGRVPTAEDSAAAILRAQEALREIEQRRQLDQRRADEEDRVRQLTRWAADDALSAADVQTDAATA
jgi:conjugative relaxase-like TrwC/TraI family protein